jgi:hypothetical protein
MTQNLDDFTYNALASVTSKTVTFLSKMGIDLTKTDFKHGHLYIHCTQFGSKIITDVAVLEWSGHPEDPDTFTLADPRLQDIAHNLDFFIKFENSIYNELLEYAAEIGFGHNDMTNLAVNED